MIRRLLIIVAAGTLVSVVCFSLVHLTGGLQRIGHPHFHAHYEGPHVTRDLPWTGGESLEIDYPGQITYVQGPQAKFTVSGPESVVNSVTLQDGRLTGAPGRDDWKILDHGRHLEITVTSPNTHIFHLNGAQQLSIKQFDQDSLELHLAGAGQVEGQGRAKTLEVQMSGAGQADLDDLPVQDAKVSISGAGEAELDPKASADISIAGAGHVNLKTRPPALHTSITGFGSIDHP